ncbi:unnamed protein product, partial [Mycena citricolor]
MDVSVIQPPDRLHDVGVEVVEPSGNNRGPGIRGGAGFEACRGRQSGIGHQQRGVDMRAPTGNPPYGASACEALQHLDLVKLLGQRVKQARQDNRTGNGVHEEEVDAGPVARAPHPCGCSFQGRVDRPLRVQIAQSMGVYGRVADLVEPSAD